MVNHNNWMTGVLHGLTSISVIKIQVTHFLALGRFLAARAAALRWTTMDQSLGGSHLGITDINIDYIMYIDI